MDNWRVEDPEAKIRIEVEEGTYFSDRGRLIQAIITPLSAYHYKSTEDRATKLLKKTDRYFRQKFGRCPTKCEIYYRSPVDDASQPRLRYIWEEINGKWVRTK